MGTGVPSPSGERRKLPKRGPGQSPDQNGFYAYFRSERSHLETPFAVFLSDGGAPKRRGARENFPPPPIDGPGIRIKIYK